MRLQSQTKSTSGSYFQLQLDAAQQKRQLMSREIGEKDAQIAHLQTQLIASQQLTEDTLTEWRSYKQTVERQLRKQTVEVETYKVSLQRERQKVVQLTKNCEEFETIKIRLQNRVVEAERKALESEERLTEERQKRKVEKKKIREILPEIMAEMQRLRDQ